MWLWMLLAGIVITAAGVLAYLGRWRSWAFRGGYRIGFMAFFGGTGTVLTSASGAWAPHDPTGLAGFGVLLGVFFWWVALVSAFWLPRFLQPQWFRQLQSDRKGLRAELRRAKQRDQEWKARRGDGTPPDRRWLR